MNTPHTVEAWHRRDARAVLAICGIVFATGLMQGKPALLMFMTALSLAVAAVPEALPAVITLSLGLGARRHGRGSVSCRSRPGDAAWLPCTTGRTGPWHS